MAGPDTSPFTAEVAQIKMFCFLKSQYATSPEYFKSWQKMIQTICKPDIVLFKHPRLGFAALKLIWTADKMQRHDSET